MKRIILLFTLSVPLGLFGQISLDSASVIPGIGETVDYYIMDNPGSIGSPGASGLNQTWDFSSITKSDSTDREFEGPRSGLQSDPANTTLCEQYPGFGGRRIQYKSSPTALYIMGSLSGINQISYRNDSLLKFQFPVVLNDSYTSSYHIESGGVSNTRRKGTYKVTVDGSGSVVLPYGTLDDVLRVKIEESYHDTTGRFQPRTTVYSSTTYEYWQKGTVSYVMSVKFEDDNGTLDTIVEYRKASQVVVSPADTGDTQDPTSILVNTTQSEMRIYPNPASEIIRVTGGEISPDTKVSIINLTGSFQRTTEFGNGVFDLSDYPSGSYLFIVEDVSIEPIRFIKKD